MLKVLPRTQKYLKVSKILEKVNNSDCKDHLVIAKLIVEREYIKCLMNIYYGLKLKGKAIKL